MSANVQRHCLRQGKKIEKEEVDKLFIEDQSLLLGWEVRKMREVESLKVGLLAKVKAKVNVKKLKLRNKE